LVLFPRTLLGSFAPSFADGHPYLGLADECGDWFKDAMFAPLFPTHGQPALAPWRLALVTMLEVAEGLFGRAGRPRTAHT
jgi:transposase